MGVLEDHLRCRRCQFDLYQQVSDAACPECGLEVAVSLRGHDLRYANPVWLRELALGARVLGLGIIGLVLTFAGNLLADMVGLRPSEQTWFVPMLVSAAALLYGSWLVTRVEPDEALFGFRRLRRIVRGATVLTAGGVLGVVVLGVSITWVHRLGYRAEDVLYWGMSISILASVAGCVLLGPGLLVHMDELMQRIPDPAMTARTMRALWETLGVALGGAAVAAGLAIWLGLAGAADYVLMGVFGLYLLTIAGQGVRVGLLAWKQGARLAYVAWVSAGRDAGDG